MNSTVTSKPPPQNRLPSCPNRDRVIQHVYAGSVVPSAHDHLRFVPLEQPQQAAVTSVRQVHAEISFLTLHWHQAANGITAMCL